MSRRPAPGLPTPRPPCSAHDSGRRNLVPDGARIDPFRLAEVPARSLARWRSEIEMAKDREDDQSERAQSPCNSPQQNRRGRSRRRISTLSRLFLSFQDGRSAGSTWQRRRISSTARAIRHIAAILARKPRAPIIAARRFGLVNVSGALRRGLPAEAVGAAKPTNGTFVYNCALQYNPESVITAERNVKRAR